MSKFAVNDEQDQKAGRPGYATAIEVPGCGITLKNRLVKAAMVEGLASVADGLPNELHHRLYATWAEAGFGMIITGNAIVCPSHLGTPGDLRIPIELSDMAAKRWEELSSSMKTNGGVSILQLVHTGRQSIRGAGRWPWRRPLGPSPIAVSTNPTSPLAKLVERVVFQTPKEMDQEDIDLVIGQFVQGALVAARTGFHGVEVHASHGYLLSSFLSPKTNRRTDAYGGSPKARLKILLDILEATRRKCPRPFVIGIKLNSADYLEGGLTEDEALLHVRELVRHGMTDFIEISGGSYESLAFLEPDRVPSTSSRTHKREAMFSSFASQAKRAAEQAAREHGVHVPLIMCTGGFRTAEGMERAIAKDGIDLIGLGRPSAVDPSLTRRLLGTLPSTKSDGPNGPSCVDYQVKGGAWLRVIVPLQLVGGGLTTMWHQFQIWRIARDQKVQLDHSFERFVITDMLASWPVAAGLAILSAVVGLGWQWA